MKSKRNLVNMVVPPRLVDAAPSCSLIWPNIAVCQVKSGFTESSRSPQIAGLSPRKPPLFGGDSEGRTCVICYRVACTCTPVNRRVA